MRAAVGGLASAGRIRALEEDLRAEAPARRQA